MHIHNIVALTALVAVAFVGPSHPVHADFQLPALRVTTFPPQSDLQIISDLALGAFAQDAFDRDFANATYFSAFALSKDGGFGYTIGANSAGAARDMAQQQCLAENGSCVVVAEILPLGYVPPAPGEVFLRTEAADFYNNPSADVNGRRAMAISEDGAWAYMWGYQTQPEADIAALDECERNRSALLNLQDWPCFLVPIKVK